MAKPNMKLASDTPEAVLAARAERVALVIGKLAGLLAGKAFQIEVDLPKIIGDDPFTEAEVNEIIGKLGKDADATILRQARGYLRLTQSQSETIVASAEKFATDHKGETTANAFTLRNNMLKKIVAGVPVVKAIENVTGEATILNDHDKYVRWLNRGKTWAAEPKGAPDWSKLDTSDKRPGKEKVLAAIATLKAAKFLVTVNAE